MKKSTKLFKGIVHLNNLKNILWDLGFDKDHEQLIKMRERLIKKLIELKAYD